MRNYFALIDEADGSFGVSFPDLPGCVAMADTLDGAADAAREALALFLDELVSDGAQIPTARTVATLRADKEVRAAMKAGALAVLISLTHNPEERERINIMLSKNLLEKIDDAAEAFGVNRSAFLERAAMDKLSMLGKVRRVEGLLVDDNRGVWFEIMVDRSSYNGWVSTEALQDLARHRKISEEDLLSLFRTFQSVVIDAAAEKIRTNKLKSDGTFVVKSNDVEALLKRYRIDPVA